MTHQAASDLVAKYGGTATHNVSRQTTMLVIGEEGWPLEENGHPSQKLLLVTEWNQHGAGIKIVPESDWLRILDLDERRQEVHRLHTPAMLSSVLGLSVSIIRRWERIGLIKPVRKIFRLPYFDFQEVSSARRLTELLNAGIARDEIEQSLTKLQQHLGGIERPLAQLEILARDSHVLCRDDRGLIEPASGQRVFDFVEEPQPTPVVGESALPFAAPEDDDLLSGLQWYQRGCDLLDEDDASSAVEAFRMSLISGHHEPDVYFHLALALYRTGNRMGALERYHCCVEADHTYLEAWTQLGCLYDELGESDQALDAFDVALQTHPDCPEAHFHKADLLARMGNSQEAIPHWQNYLRFDDRGPWAEIARDRLAESAGEASVGHDGAVGPHGDDRHGNHRVDE